jgi:hypothetical protein
MGIEHASSTYESEGVHLEIVECAIPESPGLSCSSLTELRPVYIASFIGESESESESDGFKLITSWLDGFSSSC